MGPTRSDDHWPVVRTEVGRTATTVVQRPGEGPPLVLCHGIALDHRFWAGVTSRLPTDLGVLAYDLRNHGASRRMSHFTLAECADDLVEILAECEIERIHLAGHSLGGAVAQEFALRHHGRLAGLTLMGTSGRAPGSMQERAESAGRTGLSGQVDETLARWFSPDFLLQDGPWVAYARACLLGWDVKSWSACWLSLSERDVIDKLAHVDVPALCLAGANDLAAPVPTLRALSDALPHSRLEVVPGGHMFPAEAPEETAGALTRQHARIANSTHEVTDKSRESAGER